MRIILLSLLLILYQGKGLAQTATPIVFNNPSFEDVPQHSRPPIGWFDCSTAKMSPIDTHPSGAYSVEKEPKHGNTYVGLVTRDNNTWEKFGQRLPQALVANQAYAFSVFLAQSRFYLSLSLLTQLEANYIAPVRLRVWGGFKNCSCASLLAISPPIDHFEWHSYQFQFVPDLPYTHLTFEVYYADDKISQKQNGHILMDQLSPIVPLNKTLSASIPLEKVEIAQSKQSSLPAFIQQKGPQIKINNSQLFLEQHTFLDPKDRQWVSNQYLWEIGQQFLQHPSQQLIISIDREDFIFNLLKQQLSQELVAIGLYPDEDFIIKKWKKKYRKQNWLWSIKEHGISMRLEGY